MRVQNETELLHLTPPHRGVLGRTFFSMARKPLTRVLRFKTLNTMYSRLNREGYDGDFVDRALELLGVRFIVGGRPVETIPATGPVVVVCNHPFGAVEGLLLVKMLRRVRPDVRVLANYMLGAVPEMREHLIEVDPFGKSGSQSRNISGLKGALGWLKQGGLLAVFPSGEVSSLVVRRKMVADPEWNPIVAGLIRKSGARVVPVFFDGRNSDLFQALGLVHPRLRTVLLPHENLKIAAGPPIRVAVGTVIEHERLARFDSNQEMTAYLRFRTYLLRKDRKKIFRKEPKPRKQADIANSRGRHILASEVAALPDGNILIRSGDFTVFQAGAFQIPRILREIGILRERTFREVGEGTGKPMDIDRFDDTYRHLVLWNHAEREVAGAYRFGLTDEILPTSGVKGLYSSTLFKFRPGLIENLGPAMEMGRSFIIAKYQKSYQPLLLLWKGIAAFVVDNPKYTKLFGCVSVSGEYSGLSRELIVGFMREHSSMERYAGMAIPRRPPQVRELNRLDVSLPAALFNDPEEVAALVGEVELTKSIPVLLKQYLKLGGRILGFNMDPDFGNCMDGLILVDLMNTDRKILERFMGKDEAAGFCAATSCELVPPVAVHQ